MIYEHERPTGSCRPGRVDPVVSTRSCRPGRCSDLSIPYPPLLSWGGVLRANSPGRPHQFLELWGYIYIYILDILNISILVTII